MPDAKDRFDGSIAEIYDRLLVPMLFEPCAADLAARIAMLAPEHVLEVAAGTGALTRAMDRLLPPAARIAATDLSPAMLQRAASRLNGRRLSSRQADALALPFDAESFDVVVCQFGVMFFPDRVAGYGEARRVLKPGGRLVFSVWDRIETNDFADVVTRALEPLFPHDPPRFMARIPHGYWQEDHIRADLAAAGLGDIRVAPFSAISKAASARDAAVAFCQGTPMRNEIEQRDAGRLEEATQAACEALERLCGSGPIAGRMRALVFSAQS